MIHLDTNFLVDALVPGSPQEARLLVWLGAGEPLGMSAVAWGEFLCGPITPQAEAVARTVLPMAEPLLQTDAERAAVLFNQSGRRSRSLPDAMIAAVALRVGATVATSNRTDFVPFQALGLKLA